MRNFVVQILIDKENPIKIFPFLENRNSSINYLIKFVLPVCLAILLLFSCSRKKEINMPLFKTLESDVTGLNFSNKLTPTAQFNLFSYMYYYNGAGIGAGDFNNDGLIDLFFSAN